MKYICSMLTTSILCIGFWVVAHAHDMREVQIQAQKARQSLIDKAAAEKRAAEEAAAAGREAITRDRAALQAALASLEEQNRRLKEDIGRGAAEQEKLAAEENELSRKVSETEGMVRELVGVIRVNAKDLSALIDQSLATAILEPDTRFLSDVAGQSRFPGMEDVRRMADLLRAVTRAAGEVSLRRAAITDRAGNQAQAQVLLLGSFTAAYRTDVETDEETGFLAASPNGRNLYALSKPPSRGMRNELARYMDGQGRTVPMDISRGGALRQLTHTPDLWEQIDSGGPIVWPILGILVLGAAIVVERALFLWRRRLDVEPLMGRLAALAAERDWEEGIRQCRRLEGKPVARVLAAGLEYCRMKREEMENVLQEAILRETPALERYLSTLAMLAAIAPLLGLLGTVTGMIDTFHVITQHGTGDPRMMSGGISEALVTTMLGLVVAVPIMLAHTLLVRSVDTLFGQMEEKAVALVNIVHKYR